MKLNKCALDDFYLKVFQYCLPNKNDSFNLNRVTFVFRTISPVRTFCERMQIQWNEWFSDTPAVSLILKPLIHVGNRGTIEIKTNLIAAQTEFWFCTVFECTEKPKEKQWSRIQFDMDWMRREPSPRCMRESIEHTVHRQTFVVCLSVSLVFSFYRTLRSIRLHIASLCLAPLWVLTDMCVCVYACEAHKRIQARAL